MRALISTFKLAIFILWSLLIMPIQAISALIFGTSKKFYIVPKIYNSFVCFIYGIRVKAAGTPDTKNHVVFVGNHLSYIDISIMGATLPATFISKADVKKWPIFGVLAILTKTVFIERNREAAAKCITDIKSALEKGRSLILFPEGTSTQGLDVLPFKSSIFDLFLSDDLKDKLHLQPFTITITGVNGAPVKKQQDHDLYAWHGDMTMLPHLFSLGRSKGVDILMTFHETKPALEYDNRKTFANDCHAEVQKGLKETLSPALDLNIKPS